MAVYQFSNVAPPTTLDGNINSTVTTLDVVSGSSYPGVPFKIRIGNEVIAVGAKAAETFSSLVRGEDATANVAHTDTDPVEHVVTAEDIMPRYDAAADEYIMVKDLRIATTTPLTLGGASDSQLRFTEGTNDLRIETGNNANSFTRRILFATSDHASAHDILFYDGDGALTTFVWDESADQWVFQRNVSFNNNAKLIDIEDPTAANHVGDRGYNDARYVLV